MEEAGNVVCILLVFLYSGMYAALVTGFIDLIQTKINQIIIEVCFAKTLKHSAKDKKLELLFKFLFSFQPNLQY